jgi:hypothetical protein
MPDDRQPIILEELFKSLVMPSVTISIPMPQGAGVPAQQRQERTNTTPSGQNGGSDAS